MVGQRPATENNNAAPRPQQSDTLLDGEKAGATLLFSGLFLGLVGVTFTAMGWQHYRANPSFQWTQLLGPILISVGSTFILTSACKFRIISCWPCREQREEEVFVIPVREQTRGHAVVRGRNQAVMLQGTTTMVCIPPAYNYITRDVHQENEFQPGSSVSGVHAALPPYDAVYCVDSSAFTAEEDSTASSTGTDRRRSGVQKTEAERGRHDYSDSTSSHPPAYEDIFPFFHKHNPT
ncbi:transmembrane protein 174 [Odontesthes bonariensis]|uniref:transmembrane protein 174 n=1 Tax=Odontesthes bonariensis TaxID=219752 RepID=UPI003F5876C6